jgi:hypothetical protein
MGDETNTYNVYLCFINMNTKLWKRVMLIGTGFWGPAADRGVPGAVAEAATALGSVRPRHSVVGRQIGTPAGSYRTIGPLTPPAQWQPHLPP